jgi:hypothetical protein
MSNSPLFFIPLVYLTLRKVSELFKGLFAKVYLGRYYSRGQLNT